MSRHNALFLAVFGLGLGSLHAAHAQGDSGAAADDIFVVVSS
jgi:hypothetical protein